MIRARHCLAPYQAVITGTPSGIHLDRDAGRHHGLSRRRRPDHVSGRQRLLLAHCVSCASARHHRTATRRKAGCGPGRQRPGRLIKPSMDGKAGFGCALGAARNRSWGVGFSAQGFDVSGHYERLPDSYRQDAAFIFDGVGDEKIGDFGLIGGGAAGLEVDRAAVELGTPPNALVLAQSRNLTDTYLIVPEEFLETAPGLGGR